MTSASNSYRTVLLGIQKKLAEVIQHPSGAGMTDAVFHPVTEALLLVNNALNDGIDGPKTPPQRYTLDVYLGTDNMMRAVTYTTTVDGDWVKWEDISSLFATGSGESK